MEGVELEESEIREVFDALDTDGSGLLDLNEFEVACKELGIPNDNMEGAFQVVSGIKRRKLWRDMDKETQTMWTALGWTESLWDDDGKANTEEMDWADLFPSQRKAAEHLGYSRRQWNSEGEGDDAIPWEKFLDAIHSQKSGGGFSDRLYKSEVQKRSKIEQIRSDMEAREKGNRKNHERIEAIRRAQMPTSSSKRSSTTGGGSFNRQRSNSGRNSAVKPAASASDREARIAKLAKIRATYNI